jgi:hypothetical protein
MAMIEVHTAKPKKQIISMAFFSVPAFSILLRAYTLAMPPMGLC